MSIRTLRNVILAVLTISVTGFTAGVFLLVQGIFDDFGPRARDDLVWKTQRGARELAGATDLGFAMADGSAISQAFGDFRSSTDMLAIVAVDPHGTVLATHGQPPEPAANLFSGPPGVVRKTEQYFVCWAPSHIEQAEVGRVAVVVSTRRLARSQDNLRKIEVATGVAGLLALLGGLGFVTFFTSAIVKRDGQLARHAATLEQQVAERTAELAQRNAGMRLVLDNVSQGFITVDRDGIMDRERSAIVDRWLGRPGEGQSLADYLAPADAHAAAWISMGLEALRDAELPLEVVLDQLPRRMKLDDRIIQLDYIPIHGGEQLHKLLVVMSDVTSELAREHLEQEQRELAQLFHSITTDRGGFLEFFREANQLVAQLRQDAGLSLVVEKRLVHTLKGVCGLFQLRSVAAVCNTIESRMAEDHTGLTGADREAIRAAWDRIARHARDLLGDQERRMLEVSRTDYDHLRALIERGAPHLKLASLIEAWQLEPLALRLERLGKEARHLAERLGKPPVDLRIDARDIRLGSGRYAAFFTALTHVVRNAVDHGIEAPAGRRAQGKPEAGTITMQGSYDAGRLTIVVGDDGHGIDWDKVARKARAAGLPHENQEDLEAALFSDGLSTKDEVTLVSGRGVGLAAMRASLAALGGEVRVHSQPGRGTRFEFSLPATDACWHDHAA